MKRKKGKGPGKKGSGHPGPRRQEHPSGRSSRDSDRHAGNKPRGGGRPHRDDPKRRSQGVPYAASHALGGRGFTKLKAIVDKNAKGFAFLSIEGAKGAEDIFVPPREAAHLFHGDRVEVWLGGRGELVKIQVLAHRFKELVGRFEPNRRGSGGFVLYERKRMRELVPVLKLPEFVPGSKRLQEGDWVRLKLTFQSSGPNRVTGEILEVFGAELPSTADIRMIAAEYNLEEEHTPESIRAAEALGVRVSDADIAERVKMGGDLRSVPFITIDGETARDFDDAVYVERDKSGYILWVAIADVSHYVREGGEIDKGAYERGTSVYFPERAFHMLPRALSENLCSLRPKEPRMALVSKLHVDRTGKTTRTEIIEAVIESRRRATYTEIQAEWEKHGREKDWEYKAHFELYLILRKMRENRGSIDFELPESEVVCSADGEVEAIRNRKRIDAHRLIEEFMIAANEAVTVWMLERQWPFVYRVHDTPSLVSLQKFQMLARTVGVDVRVDEEIAPKTLADLVKKFETHPAKELLNSSLLRSMKQAIYSSVHGGHFGLASEAYTHFTSPIRRYPDLVVHRLLRAASRAERAGGGAPRAHERDRLEEQLATTTDHCSYRERLAAEAERESIKLKQVRYMRKHLGQEYDARITGMVENGMFAATGLGSDDPYVEGMIHKDTFDDDLYEFNEQRMVFVGRRKKRQFKVGDPIRVQVLRADIDRRQIDFKVVN